MSGGAALDELSDTGGEGRGGLAGEPTQNQVIPEAGKGRDHGEPSWDGPSPAASQGGLQNVWMFPLWVKTQMGHKAGNVKKRSKASPAAPWSQEFPALPALSRCPSKGNPKRLRGGYFKGQK